MIKAFIVILFLFPCLCIAQLTGKVIKIADGDTFTMLIDGNRQVRIRLHGIDCPEKKQDYGQVAKRFTSDAVFGKVVTVDEKDIDRYGRTIGMVHLQDGRILNEMLLQAGLAWHYTKYDQNPKWSKMEAEARRKHIGLWKMDNAIAPWDFRHNK